MKIVKHFQLKTVFFTAVKNRCILHGRVFVMRVFNKATLQEMCCGFWLSREMWYRKSVLPGTGAG